MEFHKEILLDGGVIGKQIDLPNYYIDYIAQGEDLAITFEPSGRTLIRESANRQPWGLRFLLKRNLSVLGIKPKKLDWYRKPDLHELFRSQEFKIFLAQHRRVIWYGSSMGGYAALVFSSVHPDSVVLSLNPQSTLNKNKVPWDERFKLAWKENWDGDFSDASELSSSVSRIYAVYDPFCKEDKKHIDRLPQKNVIHLKVACVGHAIPVWLQKMGILGQIFDMVLNESFSRESFKALSEHRKNIARYYIKMAATRNSFALKRALIDRALQLDQTDESVIDFHCQLLLEEGRPADVLPLAKLLRPKKKIEKLARAYIALGKGSKADDLIMSYSNDEKLLLSALDIAIYLGRTPIAHRIINECSNAALNLPSFKMLTRKLEKAQAAKSHTNIPAY